MSVGDAQAIRSVRVVGWWMAMLYRDLGGTDIAATFAHRAESD